MRIKLAAIAILFTAAGCKNNSKPLVDAGYLDTIMIRYQQSANIRTSQDNLEFWEHKMDSLPDNFVNGPEYASALISRFRLSGNIDDLIKADSLISQSNHSNQEKEAGIFRSLASLSLLQHRFADADSFYKRAFLIEGKTYPNYFLAFDVDFERGDVGTAKSMLSFLKKGNSYGYLFRRSKYEHAEGSLDSSISLMLQAADRAGNNKYLRQTALSNAGDLFLHAADPKEALAKFQESLNIDGSDLHSITGIGWIALMHDKNYALAEKIFQFVREHQQSPDILLKLQQLAEAKKDSTASLKYAEEFASKASREKYGLMYTKYLVDLYTDVLKSPRLAINIVEKDLINRPNPQVYAWYVWSLYCNGQLEKAEDMYRKSVSGRPLEGLELYYMGMYMKGTGKNYNAQQFFKAAYKNRYDLSPAKLEEVRKNL